jgi:hypothetical protein|tara:strand:- start:158 stop:679 length:522 start_codon:yes stop_codon:yes gene_type:complete
MTTSVTGKLNKAASIFNAGESTGFGLRIGVQYYDRETKQKEWTNYEAAIFAKNPQQIEFYKSSLVEGSVVELSGESQKIKTFDGQSGQSISIELLNAKVGYIFTNNNSQPQQQQAPQQQQQQQGGYNQQQNGMMPTQQLAQKRQDAQQAQQSNQNGFGQQQQPAVNFDNDIPF